MRLYAYLLLIILVFSQSQCNPSSKKKNQLIKQADELFQNKKYLDAYSIYQQAYKIDSADYHIILYTGLSAYQVDDIRNALFYLSKSIDLNPGDTAYAFRAIINFKLGKIPEAFRDCNKSLTINPNNSDALMCKAHIEFVWNQYDQSETNIQKYFYLNPGPAGKWITYLLLASIMRETDRSDSSLLFFNSALAIDSIHFQPYMGRAMLYEKNGNWDASLKDWFQAIKFDPHNGSDYRHIAEIYIAQKKYPKCCAILDSARFYGATDLDSLYAKCCSK